MKHMITPGRLAVLLASRGPCAGAWAGTPAKTQPGPKRTGVLSFGPEQNRGTATFRRDLSGGYPGAVPYSRSLYYNDKGRERGLTATTWRDFERWLNRKYAKPARKRPLTVYIIPADPRTGCSRRSPGSGHRRREPHHQPRTAEDRWTSSRLGDQARVKNWSSPDRNPGDRHADDLSGKTVHVRKALELSTESLEALNGRCREEEARRRRSSSVPGRAGDET